MVFDSSNDCDIKGSFNQQFTDIYGVPTVCEAGWWGPQGIYRKESALDPPIKGSQISDGDNMHTYEL